MDKNVEDGRVTSGKNLSYWLESEEQPSFEPLQQSLKTDVLVIGGGIAGLTTAYCLLQQGKKVVLVEDGEIGSGESGRTTAHLTAALDDRYYEIEKTFGEDGARLVAASHTAAVDFIEKTITSLAIDCDFRRVDGYLFLHPSDQSENLKKELDATQKAGLPTSRVEQVPGMVAKGAAIRFERQAQFHILKYLRGLAQAIIQMGGQIYTRTRAIDIGKTGAVCTASGDEHKIQADYIVVATNTPVNNRVAIHTKQFPYRTYVIGCRVPKGQLPFALWWDTGDMKSTWITAPYHYVRLQPLDENYDLLIAGGEDHKTGQGDDEAIVEEDRYQNLIIWTKEQFPMAGDVVYRWSGQVMEPVDYLAFLGKNPGDDNIYIITGDSGNGMTHGTIGGMLLTDLILGNENPWKELYAPNRIPLKVPGTYFSEVFNMARQYGDWLSSGDIDEVNELAAGEGGILSKGLHKLAVYKNESGHVSGFSAVCPHLGCILQWNGDEKSFDCPCHGSRFTTEGVVVNGPATSNLKREF